MEEDCKPWERCNKRIKLHKYFHFYYFNLQKAIGIHQYYQRKIVHDTIYMHEYKGENINP